MLTMDQIYLIRFLRNHEGKSLRKIVKETGHDFQTVKKYVEKDDFNLNLRPKQKRKGKLEPFKPLIDQWLLKDLEAKPKQRHTAQRIYNRLKELYGDKFNVSDRSVRKYVAQKRQELSVEARGYLPLEHPPGEAQVDFGEAQFVEKGIKYNGYFLNISFPYSNGGYLQLFKAQNQECLLEGLKNIFEHMGKVPINIWFDNMSTVVKEIRKHGERDLTRGFERFMLHYGFCSNFTNPNSGHEKGHIENKVGYNRRNFLVPIPEFDDLKEFNQELLTLCDKDMERNHYKKSGTIVELFMEDKEAMNPLPKVPFEAYRLELTKADNYGKVKFDNHIYSSAPNMAKNQLWVKAGAHEVILMDQNYSEVIRHQRLYGEKKESMKWSPYLELMAKRPAALKYTGFFKELPMTLQDHLSKCEYEQKKAVLRLLAKMVKETDIIFAAGVFEETLLKGLKDPDSIWATYLRMSSNPVEVRNLTLPGKVPELNEYTIDSTVYDTLLRGRCS